MIIYIFLFIISFNYQDIEITRWIGPGSPTNHQEWMESQNHRELKIYEVYHSNFRNDSLVNIIITSDLYSEIQTNLMIYIQDIEQEGYSVIVDTVTPTQTITACETIRNHLYLKLPQGLVGVFFIGNTPLPWFQIINDFGYGPHNYEEFPIDLFYMDLDGLWLDDSVAYNQVSLISGSDSIYDVHSGDVSPEIWLGRLFFSSIGDEAELVNQYLIRTHLYRYDSLSAVSRGLCYVDDDWEVDAPLFINEMQYAYQLVEGISLPESTRVSSYRDHLRDNYEWVGIFCHSSPISHAFFINNGTQYDFMYSDDIPEFFPQGIFYNLYACSNARYIESNNMGCMYIMGTPRGLGSIGSTKTGAMLDFYYFYYPLGRGNSIGDAFQDWYQYMAFNGFSIYEKSYHYGMTYLGDPTLALKSPGCFLSNSDLIISDSAGNNDGRLDPGENAEIYYYVHNHYAAQTAGNVTGEIICADPDLNFINLNSNFGNIQPDDSAINVVPCSVQVSSNASFHSTSIILYITDGITNRVFSDTIYIMIGTQHVLVVDDDGGESSEQHCLNCLSNLGYGYEVISPDTFQPDVNYLSRYQAVIWLTGNDPDSTLTPQDQTAIQSYYQDTGMILIHGENIAEELQNSSFLNNFLHVNWGGNTSEHFHSGLNGDPIGNNLQLITSTSNSQDILIAGSVIYPCFNYQIGTDSLSMIRMEETGKLIFAGFRFENIRSDIPGYSNADSIYQRIMDYFEVSTGIAENPEVKTPLGLLVNKIIYNQGKIQFSLSISSNSMLEVKIYNILGSPVKTLYNQQCSERMLNLNWDLTDYHEVMVSTGVYFLRINSDNQHIVEKLYMLR